MRLDESTEWHLNASIGPPRLFFFDAVVSWGARSLQQQLSRPGSCFWTSYGARIYNRLQELMRAERLLLKAIS